MPDLVGIVPTIRSFTIFDQMATISGSPFCQSINPEIGQTGFFINGIRRKDDSDNNPSRAPSDSVLGEVP